MTSKNLSNLMKVIIIIFGICGIVLYGITVFKGFDFINGYPLNTTKNLPWMIFLLITGIPCYVDLYQGWRIADTISTDGAFCKDNSRRLKVIGILALITSVYHFIGDTTFLLLGTINTPLYLCEILIFVIGIAIAITSFVLSYLTSKATTIKEENDLTI